ncbi:MAG: hypothetical protein AMXMBFR78_17710, partial [Rubrivivax sp.]
MGGGGEWGQVLPFYTVGKKPQQNPKRQREPQAGQGAT